MPPPNHWRHPFHFLLPIFIIGAPLFGVVNAFHNNNNNYNHSGHQHHQHQAMTKKVRASTIVTEIRMSNLNIDSSSDCIGNDMGTSPNNNLSSTTLQPIKAGFIGLGTIASSIATALASSSHAPYLSQYASLSLHSIAVTKRSESKSSKLRQTFPDVVTIYDSAVDVVRNSNVVFLCVLPQQVDEVLGELRKSNVWRKEDHTLVSLVVSSPHNISQKVFSTRHSLLTYHVTVYSHVNDCDMKGHEQCRRFDIAIQSSAESGLQNDMLAINCQTRGMCTAPTCSVVCSCH